MAFSQLIRFQSSDGNVYWSDIGSDASKLPISGSEVKAYKSIEDLESQTVSSTVKIEKILAPVPTEALPIYCVGLNYHSHAKEASLPVAKYPPLWTKPAASLAHLGETIPLNNYCATSLPDYEGELVFIVANTCKDLTPAEAAKNILGYTVGNDISCRLFQLPANSSGQFFYAKAFDKFAPIGPTLIHPSQFDKLKPTIRTRVNGEIVQESTLKEDMIFEPAKVLSHMSQGTTIPAGTAVMTGTPAGVGVFKEPKSFLKDGDVVEVQLTEVCTLRNVIKFV